MASYDWYLLNSYEQLFSNRLLLLLIAINSVDTDHNLHVTETVKYKVTKLPLPLCVGFLEIFRVISVDIYTPQDIDMSCISVVLLR